MTGQEGPPPFLMVKNSMNKIGFCEQDRDISVNSLVFYYSDNTFGVVHDTGIQVQNPKKDGEDYASGVAKYENESYSVAYIAKGMPYSGKGSTRPYTYSAQVNSALY
jgi:hypothetical protein